MTLPIDFTTSLWLNNVPIWEWEPAPTPEAGNACTAPAASDSTPESSNDEASDAKSCNASPDPIPAPEPGATRPGYRLVFKGFEMAASLFLLAEDGPLARPWLRDEIDDDDGRRRIREPKPRHAPELDPPPPGSEPPSSE